MSIITFLTNAAVSAATALATSCVHFVCARGKGPLCERERVFLALREDEDAQDRLSRSEPGKSRSADDV